MAKRRKIPTPSWEHSDSGTLARKLDANRWQMFGAAGVILLVVAAIGVVGWAFLSDWIEDQRRPGSVAVAVLGQEYTVRDFGRRTELYVDQQGGQNNALFVIPTVANQLIEEAILLEFAPDEGVEAAEGDIQAEIARDLGISLDDPNYDARLQEQLAATGLSEEDYLQFAEGRALKAVLTQKFQDELPDTMPAVRFQQIRVTDQATADEVVAELEGGADFAELYVEYSEDFTEGDESGGDEGFVVEGLLNEDLENFVFGLDDGEVRTFPANNAILVIQKVEETDSHELEETQRSQLAANAYSDWFAEKRESVDVRNDMDLQEGDGDKIAWVIDHAGLVVG